MAKLRPKRRRPAAHAIGHTGSSAPNRTEVHGIARTQLHAEPQHDDASSAPYEIQPLSPLVYEGIQLRKDIL